MKYDGPGQLPELKWIALSDLFIDRRFQREIRSDNSRRNIRKLRSYFLWGHCGALIVAFDDHQKKYSIIDGQHRFAGASQRADIKELPCVVIRAQSLSELAKSFVNVNHQRLRLNSLAIFHANVAAGDLDAAGVKELIDECRITVPPYPVPKGLTAPRQTQAVGTLIQLCKRYTKTEMKLVLNAIPAAYGQQNGQMRSGLLKALAEVVRSLKGITLPTLVRILQEIDPFDLEQQARAQVRAQGGATPSVMATALIKIHERISRH